MPFSRFGAMDTRLASIRSITCSRSLPAKNGSTSPGHANHVRSSPIALLRNVDTVKAVNVALAILVLQRTAVANVSGYRYPACIEEIRRPFNDIPLVRDGWPV